MAAVAASGNRFDVIVVGSGIAGLVAALEAAPRARVAVVTKGVLSDGCSRYAQGGIAAAVGAEDSPQRHYEDTIAAGRGLCNPEAVRVLVEEGPARIRDLIEWGVVFDTQDGELLLGREAAHSEPRIIHAHGDGTGLEIETALIRRLQAAEATVFEGTVVTRLLSDGERCTGVEVCDSSGDAQRLVANGVILASGGGGRLWRHTTNPASATGDGMALAYDAGAELASMEFMQFHPTALAVPGAPRFLISEAVRGEGAHVVDRSGRRFLFDSDPRGELAGRDVVARAIWEHLRSSGEPSAYLDCSPIRDRVALRFPAVYSTCLEHGVDMARDLVPVTPAAHYLIGGVRTDTRGLTSLDGLYACGEVAYSGVHGANRLASNSLLESVVFAHRAAQHALDRHAEQPPPKADTGVSTRPVHSDRPLDRGLDELRDAMWEGAGLVRDGTGLRSAAAAGEALLELAAGDESLAGLRTRASARAASLVCASALMREETRGCHVRSEFAETEEQWHGLVVMHRRGARFERNT